MHADKIFTNGQIVTVDNEVFKALRGLRYKVKKMTAQFPIYEKGAVAIRGTEIVGGGHQRLERPEDPGGRPEGKGHDPRPDGLPLPFRIPGK